VTPHPFLPPRISVRVAGPGLVRGFFSFPSRGERPPALSAFVELPSRSLPLRSYNAPSPPFVLKSCKTYLSISSHHNLLVVPARLTSLRLFPSDWEGPPPPPVNLDASLLIWPFLEASPTGPFLSLSAPPRFAQHLKGRRFFLGVDPIVLQ